MPSEKRSNVAHYLNITPQATADDYALIGLGVSSLQMDYSPQESTEQFVHQDVATTTIDGYQISVPVDQTVYPGDEVFDFIDAIRQAGPSIGGNDLTDIVEARLYETPDTAGTSFPATKFECAISIVSGPGGDGGAKAAISWKVSVQGEPVDGDFNVSTGVFTPTA